MDANTTLSLWKKWSGLIFWSILALTIFGWIAGAFEIFYTFSQVELYLIQLFDHYIASITDIYNVVNAVAVKIRSGLSVFQLLTLAGWVAYLVGLYRFRDAQTSPETVIDVKALFKACVLGIVGILISLLGAWLPQVIGLVFSLAGWTCVLISYIRFKNTFGRLSYDMSWTPRARSGAAKLRKSAVYNIWLMIMPVITFVLAGLIVLSFFMSAKGAATAGYSAQASENIIRNYVIGLMALIGVYGLVALVLSILQFVFRLIGWYGVWKGDLETSAELAKEIENDRMSPVEPVVPVETKSDASYKKWWIAGGTAGVVAGIIILISALSGSKHADYSDDYDYSEYIPVIAYDDSNWSLVTRDGVSFLALDEFPRNEYVRGVFDNVYWVRNSNGYKLYSGRTSKAPVSNDSYVHVTDFCCGVAAVSDGVSPIVLIDTEGKKIAQLPEDIRMVNAFSPDGLAVFGNQSDLWGYIDTKGEVVIPAQYSSAMNFAEGYAVVNHAADGGDGVSLLIDTTGKKVALPDGFTIESYCVSDDNLIGRYNDQFAFYNLKTKELLSLDKNIEFLGLMIDGYAPFSEDEKWGILDARGNVVLRAKYDDISNEGRDMFIVREANGRSGVINHKDEQLLHITDRQCLFSIGRGYFLECIYLYDEYLNKIWDLNNSASKEVYIGRTPYIKEIGEISVCPEGTVSWTDADAIINPVVDRISAEAPFGISVPLPVSELRVRLGLPDEKPSYNSDTDMFFYDGLCYKFSGPYVKEAFHEEQRGEGWMAYTETVSDGYVWDDDATMLQVSYTFYEDEIDPNTLAETIARALVKKGFERTSDDEFFSAFKRNGENWYTRIKVEKGDSFVEIICDLPKEDINPGC